MPSKSHKKVYRYRLVKDNHARRHNDMDQKQPRQYDDTGGQFGEYFDPGSERPGYYGCDESRWPEGQHPVYPIYPCGRQWYDDRYTCRDPPSRTHGYYDHHRHRHHEDHEDVADRGGQQQEGHDDHKDEEGEESRGRARSRSGQLVSRMKNWVSRSRGASRRRKDEISGSSRASSIRRADHGDGDSPDRRRGRRRHRKRYHSEARSRSRGRGRSLSLDHEARLRHAVIAGVTAGALEALRVRREPGPWTGPKGRRVATAAFSAAAIEMAIDKHPEDDPRKKVVAARIGGLIVSRIVNGPRSGGGGRWG